MDHFFNRKFKYLDRWNHRWAGPTKKYPFTRCWVPYWRYFSCWNTFSQYTNPFFACFCTEWWFLPHPMRLTNYPNRLAACQRLFLCFFVYLHSSLCKTCFVETKICIFFRILWKTLHGPSPFESDHFTSEILLFKLLGTVIEYFEEEFLSEDREWLGQDFEAEKYFEFLIICNICGAETLGSVIGGCP